MTNLYERYENFHVDYEFNFKRDLVKPGTPLRFKNHRSTFKFRCLVHDTATGVSWIDAFEVGTQQYHSFYVERLHKIVKPKRSRRHKAIV